MKRALTIVLALVFAISFTACEKAPFLTMTEPRNCTFTRDGGTQSFSFTCNRDWSVSSSDSWIKVSPSSGVKSDQEVTITITCSANTTYDPRNATITVRVEELTETISVTQETGLGLIVSPTTFDLTNAAQEIEIEVQKNVQYAVSIDDACKDWISQKGTKALSSEKVTFAIAANETYDNREGKITIKQIEGELASTVIVKQKASNIVFADSFVEECLVELYDLDGDGGISKSEAESVSVLASDLFWKRTPIDGGGTASSRPIKSFNELQYFTGLTVIPQSCFGSCTELESIKLPPTITTIEASAFLECRALSNIDLPQGLHTIMNMAFLGCTTLRTISFPSSLKEIGEYAFSSCLSLESIDLPEGLTTLGNSAFSVCGGLKEIRLPSTLDHIPMAAFISCESLTSISIPDSVSGIGQGAFYMCHALREIRLPDTLTVIAKDAFADCDLRIITIPRNVSYIGSLAFGFMPWIEKVTVLCETPPYSEGGIFEKGSFPIYVPSQSVDLYKTSAGWSYNAGQIQAIVN